MMITGLEHMEPELRHELINSERIASGHCGEDAYLTYYGRNCPFKGTVHLSKEGKYRIEVIDIWNMTRTTILTDARADVDVPLPGKEYLAILAIRTE